MAARPWPAPVDVLLDRGDHEVEPIGVDRWAAGTRRVVRFDGRAESLEHERLLRSLSGVAPFGVPIVVGREGAWLVIEVPAGIGADRPEDHAEPGALAQTIGRGLAAFHSVPVAGLGLATEVGGWAPVVDRCRRRVAARLVEPADLPTPYDRYRADELLAMLIDGPTTGDRQIDDEPVLCHGCPTAGRFLVDGGEFVGFDGLETAMVADRHLDLAAAHLSVAAVFGPESVYGLYEGYGSDPDLARLDRGVLASHLLGSGRARS